MKLKFKTSKPLIINLVSLYGNSKIYLDDEPNIKYNIRGRDDRLSLAIPSTDEEAILIVENLDYEADENIQLMSTIDGQIVKPGVAFSLEYYLRSINLNLDEIYLGKTSEIAYKSSDLPLYYYAKLNDLENDINVFFNFHDLILLNQQPENWKIKSDEFNFKASIISQQDVYKLKVGDISTPTIYNQIKGQYDPSLQAGQLLFSSPDLEAFKNIPDPTLYLSIEKCNTTIEFKRIRLELTAVQKNSDVPVTEKLYQYGKIINNDMHSYKLRVDNETGDMRIQFSTNSKNIDFTISYEKEDLHNSTFSNNETKIERGKVFVTFNKPIGKDYIYLNVFSKNMLGRVNDINNYVFKYINSFDRQYFFEYPILNNNDKINLTESGSQTMNIKFNKIDRNDLDITYLLRMI